MSEVTVPMDDKALFDAATSDAAPVTDVTTQEVSTEQASDENRDPATGRFVAKTETTEQAPAQAVAEQVQQPVVQTPAPQVETRNEPPPGWLPAWRVREMVEAAQRKAAPPPEPIDPYVDPEKFRDYGVRQAVDPIAQQLTATREYFSRKSAIATHGADIVQDAYKWLETATHAGDPKIAPLLQRITSSIDPFEDVVTAFKREKALSTVGDDPNAWFEKELERRLTSDPAFKAKFQPAADQQQPNGAAPAANVVKLPPSLNRQPGTSGNASPGTMSDADLYRSAIS